MSRTDTTQSTVNLEEETRIGDFELLPSKREMAEDDVVSITVRFRLLGGLRNAFTQPRWEQAYNQHDTSLRLTCRLQLAEKGLLLFKSLGEPVKWVRRVSLYWSRSPDVPHRIWAMVIEDENPVIPKSVEEARSLLFDVDRTFKIHGKSLGRGIHRIAARAGVKWGEHVYCRHGSVQAMSPPVRLACR